MASFTKGGAGPDPFGKNAYLRSTQDVKKESYTVAASTVALETVNGVADQKVLQSGEVMAKIISGSEAGKIGPFQRGTVNNEVQTIGLGAATAGTITITFDGAATGNIAFNATAAAVQAALEGLPNVDPGDIVVTGGPLPGVITLTFGGRYAGRNVAEVVVTPTGLTGGVVTVTTTTQGGAVGGGPTDGRADPANIVGINDTFLPWQLLERDVEVAVAYEATAVQGWCFERDVAGARIALSNATADAMRGVKGLDVHFK